MQLRQRQLVTCLTAALCGIALAPPILAQEQAPPTDAADAAVDLDKIVVTAQSREQELKDVPITLQVIEAKTINDHAATNMGDLGSFLPGVVVNSGTRTQSSFEMRGISGSTFALGTEPSVGVYVDGVYSPRGGITGALLDVERIELLKGPQGTLFGRNTAAGAVSIITRKPGYEFEGEGRLRIGNDGQRYADALLNVPTGDTTAFRIGAMVNKSDGWLQDAATDRNLTEEDEWAVRAAFRWDIGDRTRAVLTWDHDEIDQSPPPFINVTPLPAEPGRPPFPADRTSFTHPQHTSVYSDRFENETLDFDGLTLSVEHNFDWGYLTSTTAVRDSESHNPTNDDGTNRRNLTLHTENIESNTSVYQEFKFNGTTDAIDWVAGTSFYRERGRQTSGVDFLTDSADTLLLNFGAFEALRGALPPEVFQSVLANGLYFTADQILQANGVPLSVLGHPIRETMNNTQVTKAYAAFGDVIWHVNDRLNLTFGLRYTYDKKRFTWLDSPRDQASLEATYDQLEALGSPELTQLAGLLRLFSTDFAFDNAGLEGQGVMRKDSWSDWSPRFVVDYHLDDDTMVFASLAKGYKAGGYNAIQINSLFDNEDVWNFETGLKKTFPEYRLAFNAAGYYYLYKNIQALEFVPASAGGIPNYQVTSSDRKAWGIDLDAQWQATDALRFGVNGAFIDQTYKDYVVVRDGQPLDLSGEATGTPYWTFAANANYLWNLGDGGDLEFTLNYAYRGKKRCNEDAQTQGDCFTTPNWNDNAATQRTDARIAWHSATGMWGAALFANNLFDQRYADGVGGVALTTMGLGSADITAPRMYGLELSAKF